MTCPDGPPAGLWAAPAYNSAAAAVPGGQPRTPRAWSDRLRRLAAWTGTGLLLTASVVLFPVGLLALPLAVAALAFLATRRPAWPEVLGLLPGAAVFTAYVAYRNRDHQACGAAPSGVVTPGADMSCGGIPPEPWIAATALLLAVTVIAYAVALAAEQQRVP